MEFVIVLAILALLVIVVSAPLRRDESSIASRQADNFGMAELEAARAAKYREIRDAELDHRTGKLSDADFAALDRELRGEAVDILRELDRAERPAEQLPSEPR